MSTFHYIPLHQSPMGKKYNKENKKLKNTDLISSRILRLPLWIGMNQNLLITKLQKIFNDKNI